ncbi:dihydrolipoamide acetyltransferase family protein [Aeribacillus pallidus]|uniref:dihydrolipoamide acetyltransferase family protein n=1 Tax=Aeribacillus pallidus TaxID=33936 RepID=UPI003D24A527
MREGGVEVVEVKLHDIGEGMTDAMIMHYFVKKGDEVKADQPLVEIQTDKMTAEIPAPSSGVINDILIPEGQTVEVGTTLLLLQPTENIVHSEQQRTEKQIPVTISAQNQQIERNVIKQNKKPQRILAAPYTRKIARDHGVDLLLVKGTGPAGRIMDEDVYRFIQTQNHSRKVTKPLESKPQFIEKPSNVQRVEDNRFRPIDESHEQTIIPFRGRRKQIANKMTQSLYRIAHCTHFEEIDVTELNQLRNELKENNMNISATAFFIKALSLALKQFPIFNAKLDEENEVIRLEREHHIGIAVDTNEGLIVPVIKNVEKKSLRQIHDEAKALTKKALENKLSIQDISGGTFTISNVGPLGGSIGATPIINDPEVALVAFHKTKKRPVVTEHDEIVIRQMMNISMSFDHRVADGATAVHFTNYLMKLIENPKLMLVEMV